MILNEPEKRRPGRPRRDTTIRIDPKTGLKPTSTLHQRWIKNRPSTFEPSPGSLPSPSASAASPSSQRMTASGQLGNSNKIFTSHEALIPKYITNAQEAVKLLELVRHKMEVFGITQSELSRFTGATITTVGRWLSARATPSRVYCDLLRRFLETPILDRSDVVRVSFRLVAEMPEAGTPEFEAAMQDLFHRSRTEAEMEQLRRGAPALFSQPVATRKRRAPKADAGPTPIEDDLDAEPSLVIRSADSIPADFNDDWDPEPGEETFE